MTPAQDNSPSAALPPGPRARFPGELLFAFQRDPTGFLTVAAREHGDVVYFKLGPYPFYLLNHPELVKQVLVTQHRNFMKGPAHQQAKRVLGDGLLTSEGQFHLSMRRLVQPVFHRRHLENYAGVICELVDRTLARWHTGETRDINSAMWDLALRIIARTLFNSTVEAEADEISAALADLTRMFNPLFLLLADWLERVPNPLTRRYAAARTRLDDKIYRAGDQRGDLPALLHAAQYAEEGREGVSAQQVRDELLTVFIAGLGTTAYGLSRTWYLLSQHPEVEKRFHDELDLVLGGRLPTAEDMDRLVYTRRVFTEAMRLYPPSWITDRVPVEDYKAGDYGIPAGSTIILSQWVTHRDSRWYNDPLRFDPDRWLPEHEKLRPEFSYFPFGGGPRLCIGEPLAWMSAMLILSTIGQQWQLRLSPAHPPDLTPRFSWNPNDTLYLQIERR